MGEFLDFPTLIVIVVAVIVLVRLRSVLGTRNGNERPPVQRENPLERKKPTNDDVVVPLPTRAKPNIDEEELGRHQRKLEAEIEKFSNNKPEVAQGLADIAATDPSFMPKTFIEGAKSAYEMIITAFASGDRKTLKMLLDKDVYDSFEYAIKEREANGQTVEFTFVGLSNIQILSAEVDRSNAVLNLRFDADVVSVTKNSAGEIIEGIQDKPVAIADEWTFLRNTKSKDPNWKLVATNDLE